MVGVGLGQTRGDGVQAGGAILRVQPGMGVEAGMVVILGAVVVVIMRGSRVLAALHRA